METRANYLIVGAFTLAVLTAAFIFAVWLAKITFDRRFATYDIYFAGSVAGVKTGGDVFFNGIRIGEVQSLNLSPKDPDRVRIRVEVNAATPIGEDTVASLELQGFTGVTVIQLSGGRSDSGALPVMPGEDYPVIRSRRSRLDELLQSFPSAIAKATELLQRLNLLLSDDNRQRIGAILDHVEVLTGRMAEPKSDIGQLIAHTNGAAAAFQDAGVKIARLSERLNDLVGNADTSLATDVRPLLSDLRVAIHAIDKLSASAADTLTEARPGLVHFANQGLPEFTAAANDLRQLSQSLDRVLRRFESDPARFLLGDGKSGYEPK